MVGGIRNYFYKITIPRSKICPGIEILQKKREDFVQNSPFLVKKYFQTQENTSPRARIFPTKNVGKKERVCFTKSTVILQSFRMQGIEKYNTNNRILRYKIFPTKNVANGDRLKYFLQKMLQKYRRSNRQKFGKSNRQKF